MLYEDKICKGIAFFVIGKHRIDERKGGMAEEIEIGSVVLLNGGGPLITVSFRRGTRLTGTFFGEDGDPKEIELPEACFHLASTATSPSPAKGPSYNHPL